MTRKCVQCGKSFELSQSEIDFYNKKGLELPKRCRACREANKSGKTGSENGSAVHREVKASSGGTGKTSFLKIAAAVLIVLFLGWKALTSSDVSISVDDEESDYQSAVTEDQTDVTGQEEETETDSDTGEENADYVTYSFRSSSLLEQHYEKHGIEMGFSSAEEYEKAASDVVNNPDALHKTEAEDGDYVYYVEETNEFVILSTEGYIRTYFNPSSGIDYYNRQ